MNPPPGPAGAAGFNAWGVEFLTPFGPVLAAAAALLALAALSMSLRGLHTFLAGRQRAALAAMRTAATILVLAVFLEPAVVYKKVSRLRSRVAVLVDTSSSMSLPVSPGGRSRGETAAGWIRDAGPDLRSASERFAISWHAFDSDARQVPAGTAAAAAQSPAGRGTDVLRAVDSVVAGDTPLSAVVLVTDGVDRADLAGAFDATAGNLHGTAKAFFRNLGAPVHVFVPADPAAVRDVAVTQLAAPHVAFAGTEAALPVVVTVHGFDGAEIPVTLRAEGQAVRTQTIKVEPGRTEYRLSFKMTPSRAAAGVVSVSVPLMSGDADPRNNVARAVLKVVRDRTRVLQVAGGPSWDVRFLRQFLKKSPGVDLISFFILRTLESQVNAPDDELSLIPFPTDEVFRSHIDTFDAVIFQDFNFSPYGMHGYLPGLLRFVENGGGLLIAGGNRSLSTGEYRASAIDPLLPVTLLQGESALNTDAFQPVLADAGEAHPATALGADTAETRSLWRNTPAINGLNLAASVRDGASVLLAHPYLKSGDRPAPVLAVKDFGKGRVAMLMTDESWRFEFSEAAFGESRLYRRFFENMLRWLAGDPSLERVSLDHGSSTGGVAAPVLHGVARGVDFRPVPGAVVRITLKPIDAGATGASPEPRVVEGTTGPDGEFSIPAAAVSDGAYEADAAVVKDGAEVARVSREIVVDTRDPEKAVPHANLALMKAVAAASGGSVNFIPKDRLSSIKIPDRAREVVDKKEHRPLWDRTWIVATLGLVLATEWFLRRRWGQQ